MRGGFSTVAEVAAVLPERTPLKVFAAAARNRALKLEMPHVRSRELAEIDTNWRGRIPRKLAAELAEGFSATTRERVALLRKLKWAGFDGRHELAELALLRATRC